MLFNELLLAEGVGDQLKLVILTVQNVKYSK